MVWLLVAGGVACLLGPELLYVRDEFDDGPLYRMNTVFKLGYQAWLLLGLAGIGALAWRREWLARRRLRWTLGPAAALLVAAALVYPVAGTYARKDAFDHATDARRARLAARPRARGRRRDRVAQRRGGRGPRSCSSPSGTTTPPSATRASRRSPGCRPCWGGPATRCSGVIAWGRAREDVARMYESPTTAGAEELLRRYGVRWVVVGDLERTEYGDGGVAKWDQLGAARVRARRDDVWRARTPTLRPQVEAFGPQLVSAKTNGRVS